MNLGPYEVVRELGRGGMGVVYEVRHPEVGRPLALKLVDKTLADAQGLERFGREAALLARVRHPNVLAVHALGKTEDGHPYLVTDLVEGRSLQAVRRDGPLPERRVAEIARDLCRAVEAVHAQGILHRDLKAENVILSPEGAPVLLDFGLARELGGEALTRTGVVLGTPGCMAPEQASGESPSRLDARADVYGLGAVLFQLLAGRAPFEGASLPQVIYAVLEKEPLWPSQDTPGVSGLLDAICRKALAKEKHERYPSARELGDDLERFLRGETPLAAARGRCRAAAFVAAGVVLAVAGVAAIAWPRGTAPPPPPPATPPAPAAAPPPRPAGPRAPARGAVDSFLRALEVGDPAGVAKRRAPLARLVLPEASNDEKAWVHVFFAANRLFAVGHSSERYWWCDPRAPATTLPEPRNVYQQARYVVPWSDKLVLLALNSRVAWLDLVDGRPADSVRFWSGKTPGQINAVARSSDGKRVALGGGWGEVWVVRPGVVPEPPEPPDRLELPPGTGVNVLAFSPDDRDLWIATGPRTERDRPPAGWNGLVRWTLGAPAPTGAVVTALNEARLRAMHVAASGLVAVGSSGGNLLLHDPAGAPITPGDAAWNQTRQVCGVRFSRSGKFLYIAYSADGAASSAVSVFRVPGFKEARSVEVPGVLAWLDVDAESRLLAAGDRARTVTLLGAGDEDVPP